MAQARESLLLPDQRAMLQCESRCWLCESYPAAGSSRSTSLLCRASSRVYDQSTLALKQDGSGFTDSTAMTCSRTLRLADRPHRCCFRLLSLLPSRRRTRRTCSLVPGRVIRAVTIAGGCRPRRRRLDGRDTAHGSTAISESVDVCHGSCPMLQRELRGISTIIGTFSQACRRALSRPSKSGTISLEASVSQRASLTCSDWPNRELSGTCFYPDRLAVDTRSYMSTCSYHYS